MFYEDYLICDESGDWQKTHDSFSLNIPENFNFAYDVIDRFAKDAPDTEALVWCDEHEERIFSFGELAKEINKAANFLPQWE